MSQYFCRPEDADVETSEQLAQEEKAPEEEEENEAEAEDDGEDGEKGPVDYNALDYETMDGAGSEKDEDKFGKNSKVAAMVKKPEPEAVPTGNGAVEEELVTKIIAKEKSQGLLLQLYNNCIFLCNITETLLQKQYNQFHNMVQSHGYHHVEISQC
jgi:hypothetical protein